MRLIEHTIEAYGPRVSNGQRSPEAIGNVLRLTDQLLQMTVSIAFRFTSRARRRRPAWLMAASAVRFADISNGNGLTCLHFEAPILGEAAKELYRQKELFKTRPNEDDTCFDLLGDVLNDIKEQKRDSYRFDARLLERVERFEDIEKRWGVESLALHGHRLSETVPARIDKQLCELAGRLELQTPAPTRARIAGKLDMIRASDGSFSMILDSGDVVNGTLVSVETDILKDYWPKSVVVEGNAVFRASGSLLRIEAEAMDLASDADRFFSEIPKPVPTHFDARRLRQRQTPSTGLGAVFGKWPGDESEEELLAALKDNHS